MGNAGFVLLVVVIIAIAIAAAVLSYQAQQKRRQELAALGARLGWEFDPDSDASFAGEFGQFGCFTRGHSRVAYNTLRGRLDIAGRPFPARMGDFLYKITTSNGKTTTTRTYRFSYLMLRLPMMGVPSLLIRREGFLDKVAGALGFDDIDFESAEFSRRFYVKSTDKRFAYDVVHPRMMEFLLAAEVPAIDVEAGCCCMSDGQSCWPTDSFERMLGLATRFFEQWPEHVFTDLEAASYRQGPYAHG